MMSKVKQKSDVLGVKMACANYSHCPICYGCRNYDTANLLCGECSKDTKLNVCNTSIHASNSISRMITKNRVTLK